MLTTAPTILKKIWGIKYEEIYSDDYLLWKLYIKKPFFNNGYFCFGINEKLINRAINEGVDKFIVMVGKREVSMRVPTRRELKEKEKRKEYEIKPSMFENGKSMKIYYFAIK
jgi:hypothetical protein